MLQNVLDVGTIVSEVISIVYHSPKQSYGQLNEANFAIFGTKVAIFSPLSTPNLRIYEVYVFLLSFKTNLLTKTSF